MTNEDKLADDWLLCANALVDLTDEITITPDVANTMYQAATYLRQAAAHERAQPASVPDDFVAWQCEKCGRYHHKHFPDEGCDWCSGAAISKRLGLSAAASNAQPASDPEPRFFIDHGVIHDRKRGRHVLGSQNDADTFGEPLQDTVDALNAMEAATKAVGGLRTDYLDECRSPAQPANVADGWRVIPFTGSVNYGDDRWEVYDPTGSGGVVRTSDVRPTIVRDLLDALAAAPQPQAKGADNRVLIALHRPGEGYEDVHPELVAEDAIREGWHYDVLTAPQPAKEGE